MMPVNRLASSRVLPNGIVPSGLVVLAVTRRAMTGQTWPAPSTATRGSEAGEDASSVMNRSARSSRLLGPGGAISGLLCGHGFSRTAESFVDQTPAGVA